MITRLVLLFSLLFMAACDPKIVYIKTYEPVNFDMPERPTLVSDGGATFDEVGKKVEIDLIELKTYAIQVESLLKEVKAKQGQPIPNNK